MNITLSILNLVEGANFAFNCINNDTKQSYDRIEWNDERPQPTWKQVEESWNSIKLEIGLIEVRKQRDMLLSKCDWTIMPDSPLSEKDKEAYIKYRQELRDLPDNIKNIDKVKWPVEPILGK